MREFKFEAWCKPTDTEPGYMIHWDELKELHDLGHLSLMEMLDMPNVYELRQYTGLNDKNGKEIFESDLLKDEENFIWEVFYENGGFRVRCNDLMAEESLYDICHYEMFHEVIGNIYENPELLKEGGM